MPRLPKFIHPVRKLREVIGQAKGHTISQPAFAAMIGTSPATIQSVELGRLNLSPALARRMANMFAADPKSLRNKKGKLKDWEGRIYNVKSFTIQQVNTLPGTSAQGLTDMHSAEVEALLMAANSPNKKRYRAVEASLEDWLVMTARDFGLEAEWKKHYEQIAERRGNVPLTNVAALLDDL